MSCKELLNMENIEIDRTSDHVCLHDLWDFIENWIRKLESVPTENYAERMIFLWVSVNAWASKSVTDLSRNHLDGYLIQCMSADPDLNKRFDSLYSESIDFKKNVDALYRLTPVFQSIWLNNKGIGDWEIGRDRLFFLREVFNSDPFVLLKDGTPKAVFSPPCAKRHIENKEDIPVDWPHVLSAIYQIRCNLFHGGKSCRRQTDRKFMQLAYEILWAVWKVEIPYDFQEGEVDED